MTALEERELAMRIRLALRDQAQSDEQQYRSAASRLADSPRRDASSWLLQAGPL